MLHSDSSDDLLQQLEPPSDQQAPSLAEVLAEWLS